MSTPPKMVDSRGRALKPGTDDSPVEHLLRRGPGSEPLLPRRLAVTLAVIVAMAIAGVGVGLRGTSTIGSAGPAPTDAAVRQLVAYATDANARQAPFPPDASGDIVATAVADQLYRVTVRSLDGRCWQVLAYTMADPQRPGRSMLDRMETTPYPAEAIHCRFNR
jgi:hypothetical protein